MAAHQADAVPLPPSLVAPPTHSPLVARVLGAVGMRAARARIAACGG
jgi:hypothetical protein